MKNQIIIGISGKAGTGKTTLARLIVDRAVGVMKRMSFADGVRDEVADLLGVSRELTRMPHFKELYFRIGSREMTGRQVLQWWGTDIRRAANPAYWVTRAMDAARQSGANLVVFDDVRFPLEARLLDRCYRLEPYDGWVNTAGDHVSETALDDYSFPPERVFRPCFGELGALADQIVRELGL